MSRKIARKFTPELARACREVVFMTAKKYEIPPVHITAHVRTHAADAARHEAMRVMITSLRLARWQVAAMFFRDLRRVRKSVLGA
jgi:hypothetical protein